ncbi:hypothetical protein AB1L42_09335 [Thalassoglobus sp. JC818]|uniref:hypothetical protein n=1 Tax=Thalassoglobus sp. JC818 TaxID=3232136 RepID=UPI003459D8D8
MIRQLDSTPDPDLPSLVEPVIEQPDEESNLWDSLVSEFRGSQGMGYAISFLLHLIVLAALAIPIVRHLQTDDGFTTIIENASNEDVRFDSLVDLSSTDEAPPEGLDEEIADIFDPLSNDQRLIPDLSIDRKTRTQGDLKESGETGEGGGSRIAEPENAIKIGSFSVWYWPIEGTEPLTGEVKHGVPGAAPRVGQKYSIVIRFKVPGNKQFVRLNEYSGSVVGTDGYTQRIPEDAYFYRVSGDLVKARPSHRIPVIDGTAEILIRVPGALYANVKDRIRVHSRTLDEEQSVELTFEARK